MEREKPLWSSDTSYMTPEMLKDWGEFVKAQIDAQKIEKGLRGLFVGISAVSHAAKMCKCEGRITCYIDL